MKAEPATLPTAPTRAIEGAEVPGYALGDVLGVGGHGTVRRATRLADGVEVAVKMLRAKGEVSEHAVASFLREIEILRSLRHANVVALLDHGVADGAFWFAMERCEGSLHARCARDGTLPLDEALRVMTSVIEGLAYAHARGMVHRDVKPGNVLLSGARVQLGDFGLAKRFDEAGLSGVSSSRTVAGTAAFMPREQVTDFRAMRPSGDVWSAAAMLVYSLSGQAPRAVRAGADPLLAVLTSPARPLRACVPEAPEALAALIDRCLSDAPEDRFRDAIALRAAWRDAGFARAT